MSILFLITTSSLFPQELSDTSKTDQTETLSRIKLSGGYFSGVYERIGEYAPFINLNYRATLLSKNKNSFEFGFTFEGGINLVSGLFPLYGKAGPEFRIIDNLIVGANIGVTGIFLYPIPFYGVNGFYLIQLSKNIYLELESGFHSPFITFENTNIFYGSVGISIN